MGENGVRDGTKAIKSRWGDSEQIAAQWFKTAMNPDVNTGPLALWFAHLPALLTHSLV